MYHYGKHHAEYVNKLNILIEGTEFENKLLKHIVKHSDGAIFNNATQIFNHNFYWYGLSPTSTNPSEMLSKLIKDNFGSIEDFKKVFLDKATSFFGSGWVWLVLTKDGKLSIEESSNADNPIHYNRIPLLTCDIWEHAYYIDYHNLRPSYLENW